MRLALVLACAFGAWAQSGNLGSGSVFREGVHFMWDTRVEPALPRPRFSAFGAPMPDGWIAQTMRDRTARVYFGYEFKVSKAADGARVEFRPLQLTPELAASLRMDDASSWTAWQVQVPEPQVIRETRWISIDLTVNPATGQKIVDYVKVIPSETGDGSGEARASVSLGEFEPVKELKVRVIRREEVGGKQ